MRNPDSLKDPWGQTTRWTMVMDAVDSRDAAAREAAWRFLIERYRQPVHAAIRRMMGSRADLSPVVDSFFSYAFERGALSRADKKRGKFRCFLQGVIRNFVRESQRGTEVSAADIETANALTSDASSPLESQEETEWAITVLGHSLEALVAAMPRDAKILMRTYGVMGHDAASTDELAAETGMNKNALYQAVFRSKEKLRELLLQEVLRTVETPIDLDEEMTMIETRLMAAFPGLLG